MSGTQGLIHLALAATALAISATGARGAPDPRVRADLERLARRSIFFGHQSVGGNILDGVRELAGEAGVPLRIVEVKGAAEVPPGSCGHGTIADNGNPFLKIESFERALAAGAGEVEIAFMKFCYVDFHEGTDPSRLLERYRTAVGGLQAKFPRTLFVHLTAPLTTNPDGLKIRIKRLLGRETSESQNARREAFNALLRQAYQGKEPLFDLARLESTDPDGRPITFAWKGQQVRMLAAAYTDDGGHLNAEGRRRVARELISFLAALPLPAAVSGQVSR